MQKIMMDQLLIQFQMRDLKLSWRFMWAAGRVLN